MTHHDLISGITNALWYNVETKDNIAIYKAIIARIKHSGYNQEVIVDEDLNFVVDIMTGILISIYGDYGTSPRFGWIEDEQVKNEIIADLEEEIQECERRLKNESCQG